MPVIEVLFFGSTLFLALVSLLRWKHRRDKIQEKLNQNLRGYMEVHETRPVEPAAETGRSLIRIG